MTYCLMVLESSNFVVNKQLSVEMFILQVVRQRTNRRVLGSFDFRYNPRKDLRSYTFIDEVTIKYNKPLRSKNV